MDLYGTVCLGTAQVLSKAQKLQHLPLYQGPANSTCKFNTSYNIKKRPLTVPMMFSGLQMLIFACELASQIPEIQNSQKPGTQLFVGIQVLQGVSQLNLTRIVVVRKMDSAIPWINSLRIQPFLLVPRRQGRFV